MSISTKPYGRLKDGRAVTMFTLTNSAGNSVSLINYGAMIIEIIVPDREGVKRNVNLAYDTLEEYTEKSSFFGSTVGRCANRIHKGFTLNGRFYELHCNPKGISLHGGRVGFNQKLWDAAAYPSDGCDKVAFSYLSPDGEEHYPGNLNVTVTYVWTDDNELRLEYSYESDRDTLVNLTNHSYFNLAGHGSGSIEDHIIQLFASRYNPLTEDLLPDGTIARVEGPYDLREPSRIGDGLASGHPQIAIGRGYDINFLPDGDGYRLISTVYDPKCGRAMDCMSDLPGVQLYTANFLNDRKGLGGAVYSERCGFCLETQHIPNAININGFEKPILRAGVRGHTTTAFKFYVKE